MDSQALILKAEQTHCLTEDELLHLLQDDSADEAIFQAADRVRQKYVGNEVHLRALIEFTNICKNNCLYCGLRAQNPCVHRYRMSEDDIVALAQKAVQYGYKTVVLQGGEDPAFTTEKMVSVLQNIKSLGLAITLSLGERPYEDYQAFKAAGADRYLLRIETTKIPVPTSYPKLFKSRRQRSRFSKLIFGLYFSYKALSVVSMRKR